MSIALLDNSTLSSIQRVLGYVEIKDKNVINGDLVAFESLINAILFYNELIVIDDYKEEYSEERKKLFPFIRFVNPDILPLIDIAKKSTNEAKKFEPCIQKGKFVDDAYKQFFELLKINIKCTWDISSSIYYLTLKMLGRPDTPEFDKYSQVCYNIFSELREISSTNSLKDCNVKLLDKYGHPITNGYKIPNSKWKNAETGGVSRGLSSFIASLNWISYRSIYYTFLADFLRADTFLHPIRQNFQVFYMNKSNRFEQNFTAEILNRIEKRATSEIENIITSTKSYGVILNTPLFIGYMINKIENPLEIINFAFELRQKKEFVQAREQLSCIRNNLDKNGFTPKVNRSIQKLISEVNQTFLQIRRSYGCNTSQGDLASNMINAINSCLSPQIPKAVMESHWINSISKLIPKRSFSLIYRNLSTELLNISKLGKSYDLLTKNVKINEHLVNYSPKTEDVKYQNFHSKWKSPMV